MLQNRCVFVISTISVYPKIPVYWKILIFWLHRYPDILVTSWYFGYIGSAWGTDVLQVLNMLHIFHGCFEREVLRYMYINSNKLRQPWLGNNNLVSFTIFIIEVRYESTCTVLYSFVIHIPLFSDNIIIDKYSTTTQVLHVVCSKVNLVLLYVLWMHVLG